MKILHISYSDTIGGASRAAYRIHRALLESGIESRMRVRRKVSDDWTIRGPDGRGGEFVGRMRGALGAQTNRLHGTDDIGPRSIGIFPSHLPQAINRSDADVVHLHWVSAETMSVEDIGRIRKPLVWTAHDMWPFCGAEHYAPDGPNARWRCGYTAANRPVGHWGIDIDRWTWRRKRRAWRNAMHIVCPSRWLASCVRDSALMREWNVSSIPNPLNTKIFKPQDQTFCRTSLNLPADRRIVLFGALLGAEDPRKGYDLLLEALRYCQAQGEANRLLCIVFGQSQPRDISKLPVPMHWMGQLHDDVALALLYGAADVIVVPSRQENLVQTGTEAQACGCPVVAFDTSGLRDVVEHRASGYLARPYEPRDLANGIMWVLEDDVRRAALAGTARQRAERLWSLEAVAPRYLKTYQEALTYKSDY